MTTYSAHLNITCTTSAEFDKLLADAQSASTVSNIVSNATALTISFDINTTG